MHIILYKYVHSDMWYVGMSMFPKAGYERKLLFRESLTQQRSFVTKASPQGYLSFFSSDSLQQGVWGRDPRFCNKKHACFQFSASLGRASAVLSG